MAIRESAQRYFGLLEMSGEAVVVVCASRIVSASTAAHDLFGLPEAGKLVGRRFLDFISLENRAAITDKLGKLKLRGQTVAFARCDLLRNDGNTVSVEVALHACGHRGRLAVQVLMRDFSEQRRLQAEVAHCVHYDPLTNVANRIEFLERLNDAIARATCSKEHLAIVRLGIDNFRAVNDALGQHGGDTVLVQVAERLTRIARGSDTIARMGGDEFGLILEGLAETADGLTIAISRLMTSLGEVLAVGGIEIRAKVSIGIAIFPVHARTPDRLMRKAMLAMKYAKHHGGDQFQLYSVELDAFDSDETRRQAQTERLVKKLTPREHEVLELLVTGKTNRMIGSLLGISARTIDIHRRRVMQKMEADSVAELVHALDQQFRSNHH
jgi:diguanylate cyclase (GGDEF)-like protein/PAS domain S-box-containing protein